MFSIKTKFLISLTLTFFICQFADAQLKVWDDSNNGNWNSVFSWNPAGSPGAGNPVIIGTVAGTEGNSVTVDSVEAAQSVQISNGAQLRITSAGALVNVGGTTTIGGHHNGQSSRITIYSNAGTHFQTDQLEVQEDGRFISINGAHINILDRIQIDPDGIVQVDGTIHFFDNVGAALVNNGTLKSEQGGLTLNQLGDSRFDLDGTTGNGVVEINQGNGFFGQDEMIINGAELSDDFSGTIEMQTASVLEMNLTNGWVADVNSLIRIEGIGSNADGDAIIRGSDWRLEGTMILTNEIMNPGNPVEIQSMTTIADSAYIELEHNNFLDFASNTTIEGGTFVTPSNSELDASVRLFGDTTWSGVTNVLGVMEHWGNADVDLPTTINAEKIDLDGDEYSFWDLSSHLTINASMIDLTDNVFNGDVEISGLIGAFELNLESGEPWHLAGEFFIESPLPFPTTRVIGTPIEIGGDVYIQSPGVRFNADTVWQASSRMEFDQSNSSLILNAETRIDAATNIVGPGTLINGSSGSMLLDDGFFHDQISLVNQGLLQIGDGPGIGTVPEFSNEASGNFRFEIGGSVAGSEFDQFVVTDQVADLAGRISVKLIDGFEPAIGDEFTVLSAPMGLNGQFTNSPVSIVNSEGFIWEVLHNPFDVTVRLDAIEANVFLGDVNEDGTVNLLDVMPFTDAITSGVYEIRADINCDGVVDLLDVAPFVDLLTMS